MNRTSACRGSSVVSSAMVAAAAGLVAIALLLPAAARAGALGPGFYSGSFVYEGLERTYTFRIPEGYDPGIPVPLVIDLHGFGSNGIEQAAISGYRQLSSSAGFIVAHPDGVANSWNGGICCGESVESDLDTVGFLKLLAGDIARVASIDPARLYVTGLSNGGAMSHRIACDAADFFAAVAPVAFGVPFIPFSQCVPSRPISIHLTMGLTDTVVPYASAMPSFEYWRNVNGCKGPPGLVEVGEGRCETYDDCADGVEVTLCSVVGADFAGTPLEDLAGHVPYVNDDFDIPAEAWAQMSRYQTDPPPVLVPEPSAIAQGLAVLAGLALPAVRRARAAQRTTST